MPASKSKNALRSNIYFAEKDQALREDVRKLGKIVGDLVREQGGEALFDLVESARRAAIAHREGDDAAIGELQGLLGQLTPRAARDLIRAFSTYFQMVNMAEKVHRIRRRRTYLQDSKTPQPYGFLDTLKRLEADGIDSETVEGIIADIRIEPVFMAHPTEATRRTLLRKQQNIARHLVKMLDPYMTPPELAATLGQIRLEATTGWQTEDHPEERSLGDDAEHVLFFLTDVLYRMIPPLYESLETAFDVVYGEAGRFPRLPIIVRFGSWVGGDMNGDPNVTGKSIRQNLARQRALILNLYYKECNAIADHLSQSETRIGVVADLLARSERYAGHFPKAAHSVPARHRKMPYRVFLRLICARLQATYDDTAFPYESAEEFLADIEVIADSLRANSGQYAGLFEVKRLLRRIRTFGFHIAKLDIRQQSLVHRRVISEGLAELDWLRASAERRVRRLSEALERRESPLGSLSSEARRTLSVFQTIAHCRRKYGKESIGPYIVSLVQGPDDILSVLLLAKWGLLGSKGEPVPLDIVPLFDTVDGLENAAEIMGDLLANQYYREHLRARGDGQMIMISNAATHRDTGVATAYWSLHKAERALIEVAKDFGIRLSFFHGRGAAIGGGARLSDAILAAPAGTVSRQLRMTEQGEMINARYGLRDIAMRTLEQMISSVLRVDAMDSKRRVEQPLWRDVMQEIADHSLKAYTALVDAGGRFDRYFRAATPIDVIERLRIGMHSMEEYRPEDRSLPAQWEFAWMQNRCLIPSWFGFGVGVEQAMASRGEECVHEMFGNWSYARMLLSDVEMSLAKADLDIAEKYSLLAGDDLHKAFFPSIREEFDRSVAIVLRLTGQPRLLERSSTLRRAIRLRNPYMDPMSFLQVDLLARWRDSGRSDDEVLQALLASINGIAHGMQSTA